MWFDHLLRSWEREHPGEQLSIRRLARRAGVNQTTVQRFKKGEGINLRSLEAIACALDLEPEELLEIQRHGG